MVAAVEKTPPSSLPPESSPESRDSVEAVAELLSKLNPSAKEFVPSSRRLSPDAQAFVSPYEEPAAEPGYFKGAGLKNFNSNFLPDAQLRRRHNGFGSGARRRFGGGRVRSSERGESVRRTIYVSDIDRDMTEEKLASIFSSCGPVIDCRICGDPHSILRFAFIEFADEGAARSALMLGGAMLGFYPLRVLPSKTSIQPVNPRFLPRTEDEKEMVVRTVYCTNIDKKVTETDVRAFFEHHCGEVARLRLLGDFVHSTCIAFVEFVSAESAIYALNCSGMVLGDLPIRVSPSKTPVRPRMSRPQST